VKSLPGLGAGEAGRMKQPRGFTLLEILVSLAVLGLILAAAVTLLNTVTGSLGREVPAIPARLRLARLADRIKGDLESAYLPSRREDYRFTGLAGQEGFGEIRFAACRPPQGEDFPRVYEVSYAVRTKPRQARRGPLLVTQRQETRGPDAAAAAPWYILAEEVAVFTAEFFDGREWLPAWDSEISGTLPRATRVRIELRDGVRRVQTGIVVAHATYWDFPETEAQVSSAGPDKPGP